MEQRGPSRETTWLSWLLGYRPGWQRLLWLIGAGIWSYVFLEKAMNHPWAASRLGYPYLWFFLIPLVPALVQALYPTRLGWTAASAVPLFLTARELDTTWYQARSYYEMGKWERADLILTYISGAIALALLGGVLWLLRPREHPSL